MGVWTSAVFGSPPNSRATPIGLVWSRVFEIRRSFQSKGEWHEAVRYGVTSLPATIAIPERLLKLKRGHWTIENGLHDVKDVMMGEDKSMAHCDNGPKIPRIAQRAAKK